VIADIAVIGHRPSLANERSSCNCNGHVCKNRFPLCAIPGFPMTAMSAITRDHGDSGDSSMP
jgi:hypothetical protein